jgi:predicted Zn-dependent protease
MNTEVEIQEQPYGFTAYVTVYYARVMKETIDDSVVNAIRAEVARQVAANPEFQTAVIRRATDRILELLK